MKTTLSSTRGAFRFSSKDSITALQATPQEESPITLHFTSKSKRLKKSTGFRCSLRHWYSVLSNRTWKRDLQLSTLDKLCKYFGISFREFLDNSFEA